MLSEIKENVSLKQYTTFRIGGAARYFLQAENSDQIIEAVKWADDNGLLFFILAGGSNLLVSDKGFKGLAIKVQSDGKAVILSETKDLKQRDSSLLLRMTQDEDKAVIRCEAGVKLSDLVKLSLERGLSGLEWAAGIPQAAVGGAIWGNAGAFGRNMADVVSEVEAVRVQSSKFKVQSYKNKDCNFGYKNSIFKRNKNLIILSAVLVLEKKNEEEVKEEVKKVLRYRKEHHPIEPSAGSVFKNEKLKTKNEKLFSAYPEEMKIFQKKNEVPAGFLIEKCGLAGAKIGGARISPKHSNFIVNTAAASAVDVTALIKLARQKVKEKFGIILEEELQYIGF